MLALQKADLILILDTTYDPHKACQVWPKKPRLKKKKVNVQFICIWVCKICKITETKIEVLTPDYIRSLDHTALPILLLTLLWDTPDTKQGQISDSPLKEPFPKLIALKKTKKISVSDKSINVSRYEGRILTKSGDKIKYPRLFNRSGLH